MKQADETQAPPVGSEASNQRSKTNITLIWFAGLFFWNDNKGFLKTLTMDILGASFSKCEVDLTSEKIKP